MADDHLNINPAFFAGMDGERVLPQRVGLHLASFKEVGETVISEGSLGSSLDALLAVVLSSNADEPDRIGDDLDYAISELMKFRRNLQSSAVEM